MLADGGHKQAQSLKTKTATENAKNAKNAEEHLAYYVLFRDGQQSCPR